MIAITLEKNQGYFAITPSVLGYDLTDIANVKHGFVVSFAWLMWSIDLEYYNE